MSDSAASTPLRIIDETWTLIELPASWFGMHGSFVGHRWCLLPKEALNG